MEFDGDKLRLDCRNPEDALILGDLALAFMRTIYEGPQYPVDQELRALSARINTATPWRLHERRLRPPLILSVDEIQVCAGLINPALKTHEAAKLPVESMERTRDLLYGLLDQTTG